MDSKKMQKSGSFCAEERPENSLMLFKDTMKISLDKLLLLGMKVG